MRRFINTLLSVLLSSCICLTAFAASDEYNEVNEKTSYFDKQVRSDEYVMLQQKDALDACATFDNDIAKANNGELIYPDSYAGRFIDGDHLVIQIASSDFTLYEYLKKQYPTVQFNQVEFSKDCLDKTLEKYMSTYDKNEEDILCAYVDVELNKIVIEVDASTFLRKQKCNTNLPIIYKVGSEFRTTGKTVHCGDKLVNKKSNFIFDVRPQVYMSAGIGARYNGQNALISCGHSMEVGDKIFAGSTHIGNVSYVSFSNNSVGDFSIITMIDDNVGDGQCKDNGVNFVTHGTINTEKGQRVMKYTENSGYATFDITETSAYVKTNINDTDYVMIKGQTLAQLVTGTVIPGDSGGGVFTKFSADGKYYFSGVMSAYGKDNGILSITPVQTILKECDNIVCV